MPTWTLDQLAGLAFGVGGCIQGRGDNNQHGSIIASTITYNAFVEQAAANGPRFASFAQPCCNHLASWLISN
jgi:hypothetical protein